MTARELVVEGCGLAAAVIALVALLLGHELVAAIVGFVAAALIWSGSNEVTTWGRKGGRWSMSESDFENLVNEVEQSTHGRDAAESRDPHDPDDFEALIAEALDELPAFMQAELARNVAIVISDAGADYDAYGLYFGDTVAADDMNDRILIFRDTLLRDYGSDPDELRRQVTITVRHELAHHLGASERDVTDLGL